MAQGTGVSSLNDLLDDGRATKLKRAKNKGGAKNTPAKATIKMGFNTRE